MDKEKEEFTHMEYRSAKVVHLVEQDKSERFIYKKQEISKEEAGVITLQYLKEKEDKKIKKMEKMKKEVAL